MVHVLSPAVTAVELYRRVRIGALPGGHAVLLYSVRAVNRCVRPVARPCVGWDTRLPTVAADYGNIIFFLIVAIWSGFLSFSVVLCASNVDNINFEHIWVLAVVLRAWRLPLIL